MELVAFASQHPFLIAAAVALVVAIAVTEVKRATRGFKELGTQEAVRLINDDAIVVDVRDPARFQAGHIGGARSVPLDSLREEVEKRLGKLKDRPILTYCDTGMMGARAAGVLSKLAFPQVYTLRGGLEAWRRESFPLERK